MSKETGLVENTELLLHDGSSKKMQDLKEGDILMGYDSTPLTVRSIEKKYGETLNIVPVKGNSYQVSKEHPLAMRGSNYERVTWDKTRKGWVIFWLGDQRIHTKRFTLDKQKVNQMDALQFSVYKSLIKKQAKKYLENEIPKTAGYTKYGDVVHIPAKTYSNFSKNLAGAYKVFSASMIQFPEKKILMDPHALGIWLGDGTSAGSEITTEDKVVVDFFTKYSNKLGLQFNKKGNTKYTYAVTSGTNFGPKGRNKFRNWLKDYNLINNKHIPKDYLHNTYDIRIKVLAGLIDSDGSYHENGYYEIMSKFDNLANDIVFLARSLGLACFSVKSIKTCTNGKNGPVSGVYNRITIYGKDLDKIPVLLKRKKGKERISKRNALVHGLSIKPNGKTDFYVLGLDNEKPFLLSDFTIVN